MFVIPLGSRGEAFCAFNEVSDVRWPRAGRVIFLRSAGRRNRHRAHADLCGGRDGRRGVVGNCRSRGGSRRRRGGWASRRSPRWSRRNKAGRKGIVDGAFARGRCITPRLNFGKRSGDDFVVCGRRFDGRGVRVINTALARRRKVWEHFPFFFDRADLPGGGGVQKAVLRHIGTRYGRVCIQLGFGVEVAFTHIGRRGRAIIGRVLSEPRRIFFIKRARNHWARHFRADCFRVSGGWRQFVPGGLRRHILIGARLRPHPTASHGPLPVVRPTNQRTVDPLAC